MTRPTLRLSEARWVRANTDQLVVGLLDSIRHEAQEVLTVLPFRADLSTCGPIEVARGGFDQVVVSIPAVLAVVLTAGCDRFAVAHNHPVGDPEPSHIDEALVRQLDTAARTTGMRFEGSYIVTPAGEWTVTNGQGQRWLSQAAERTQP